jgi:hypothetical protein
MYPESKTLIADGRDLCYIPISLTDCDGQRIVSDDREITCNVSGGELMALFSGDPMSTDDASNNKCHTFKGRALAIIRSKSVGTVHVTVHSKGLAGCSISLLAIVK